MPHVEFPKEPRVEHVRQTPVMVSALPRPKEYEIIKPQPKRDAHREKIERDLQELRDKISRL